MLKTFHSGLVALESGATTLRRDIGADLPTRLVVAPWGTHVTNQGRISINETTVELLPANQVATNFDRVALDFNHNTVPGTDSYRGEPAKVAAHARPVILAGEGIIFEGLEWTPEGREYVGGRHYIDLSPTLQLNAKGEAIFIHSAAVCRAGAIPGLSLFAADPLGEAAAKENRMRQLLAMVLGLPTDADESSIKAAAGALSADGSLSRELYERALTALSAKGADINSQIHTLSAIFDEPEEDIETAVFKRLGVADPIERKILRNAGVTADQVKKYGLGEAAAPAKDSEQEILRRLGVSAEDIAKHRDKM